MRVAATVALLLLGGGAVAVAEIAVHPPAPVGGPGFWLTDAFEDPKPGGISISCHSGEDPADIDWELDVRRTPVDPRNGRVLIDIEARTRLPTMLRTLRLEAADDRNRSGVIEEEEIRVLAVAEAREAGGWWSAHLRQVPFRVGRAWVRIRWSGEGGEEFSDAWGRVMTAEER